MYPQIALAEKFRGAVIEAVHEKLPNWTVHVPEYPDSGIDLLFDLQDPKTQAVTRIKVMSAAAALRDEDRIRRDVLAAIAEAGLKMG